MFSPVPPLEAEGPGREGHNACGGQDTVPAAGGKRRASRRVWQVWAAPRAGLRGAGGATGRGQTPSFGLSRMRNGRAAGARPCRRPAHNGKFVRWRDRPLPKPSPHMDRPLPSHTPTRPDPPPPQNAPRLTSTPPSAATHPGVPLVGQPGKGRDSPASSPAYPEPRQQEGTANHPARPPAPGSRRPAPRARRSPQWRPPPGGQGAPSGGSG